MRSIITLKKDRWSNHKLLPHEGFRLQNSLGTYLKPAVKSKFVIFTCIKLYTGNVKTFIQG